MITIIIPKTSTGGGTNVDIGPNPSQIPTNSIVQNKLNTYPILGKNPGNEDPQLPDNARVKSLIGEMASAFNDSLVAINEVTSVLHDDVEELKNNPVSAKIPYQLPCSENIVEGKYVNIWFDDGVSKIRLANATNGRLVDGYVEASFNTGQTATFYKSGTNSKGNLCPHGQLYLSTTVPGDATTDIPVDRSGHWCQEIGKCVADGEHIFELGLKIQLT